MEGSLLKVLNRQILAITLLCVALCFVLANGSSARIIGGSPAAPGEFPWLVSVMHRNATGSLNHLCGGTLVDMNYIVTAAHCVIFHGIPDLFIMAGTTRLLELEDTQQVRQVDQVKVHPHYNLNDIARLRVSIPFLRNPPYVNHSAVPIFAHLATGSCKIAGWGMTTEENSESISNVLMKASLPIVPKNECYAVYGDEFDNATQICAGFEQGGVDACTGDTGGALICNDLSQPYFAGIISWGYLCAAPRYPGVYTEVSKYIPWIQNGSVFMNGKVFHE